MKNLLEAKERLQKSRCVAIGVSAGGTNALTKLFKKISDNFHPPVVIVQHLHPHQGNYYIHFFNGKCKLTVKEANDKEPIKQKHVYFAPPNYHLLIDDDYTFALSIDARVNYSRPSVDVFFESAAEVFGNELTGIVLTGANYDGSNGIRKIKQYGGLTIAQNPDDAEVSSMPQAAIRATKMDAILTLDEIITLFE